MNEIYLFADTETTGFPSEKIEKTDPKQARCVQLAGLLTDHDGKSLAEFSCILKREQFSIPAFVADIHGISDSVADAYGLERKTAFAVFGQMVRRATTVIAHNFAFDNRVLEIEDAHHNYGWALAPKNVCTMTLATPICKLPKARGEGYKRPKMQEAYKHFFGKEFDGVHDALADVRACRDVFFKLRASNFING